MIFKGGGNAWPSIRVLKSNTFARNASISTCMFTKIPYEEHSLKVVAKVGKGGMGRSISKQGAGKLVNLEAQDRPIAVGSCRQETKESIPFTKYEGREELIGPGTEKQVERGSWARFAGQGSQQRKGGRKVQCVHGVGKAKKTRV